MPSTTRWSSMILCCSKFTWKSQAVNCSGPWSLGHFSIHWHEWCWCCSCQKWSQSVETIWQAIQGDITRGRQRWLNRHNQYSVFLEEWKKCECVTLKRGRRPWCWFRLLQVMGKMFVHLLVGLLFTAQVICSVKVVGNVKCVDLYNSLSIIMIQEWMASNVFR